MWHWWLSSWTRSVKDALLSRRGCHEIRYAGLLTIPTIPGFSPSAVSRKCLLAQILDDDFCSMPVLSITISSISELMKGIILVPYTTAHHPWLCAGSVLPRSDRRSDQHHDRSPIEHCEHMKYQWTTVELLIGIHLQSNAASCSKSETAASRCTEETM